MTAHLHSLRFDAHDPQGLARFWGGVRGRELVDDPQDGIVLLPSDEVHFRFRFVPGQEPKVRPNRMHLHLTSTSPEAQQETVDRALELGARHLDVGQLPEEEHVVLADPEGNEFCVIEAGNNFLAGCGFVGELSCDGSQAVGHFWSQALGWPLVWDQDEETAIQSPYGGTKVSWGGPPVTPQTGRNRQRFDLAPSLDGDQHAEVERLLGLGATRCDIGQGDAGQGDVGAVLLADPDGNEFGLLTPR